MTASPGKFAGKPGLAQKPVDPVVLIFLLSGRIARKDEIVAHHGNSWLTNNTETTVKVSLTGTGKQMRHFERVSQCSICSILAVS